MTEGSKTASSTALRHFSDHRIDSLGARQVLPQDHGRYKPTGFWVSIEGDGDGWSDWCRGEEFNLNGLTYEHEVTLSASANLLWVNNASELDDFTQRYTTAVGSRWNDRMDWAQIAKEYQGIVIAPYQWSRRMTPHTHWYYGWDCASGCIWDMSAIAEVRLLATSTVQS